LKPIAIVTGSNGQLGNSFVHTLMEQGYRVLGVDLQPSDIINDSYEHYIYDISSEKNVSAFFDSIKNKIDVLINNAGIGVFTPMEKRTAEEFISVMNVNLLGTFLMSRAAIKNMQKYGGGSIINIASIYGSVSSDYRIYGDSGRNNSEVYSMTKAGVIQFARYVAANYAHKGIRMNCISPGGIYRNQNEFFVKNYINKTPAQRMGDVDDLQSAIKFLIDTKSSYVNGQDIIVDGGFSSW